MAVDPPVHAGSGGNAGTGGNVANNGNVTVTGGEPAPAAGPTWGPGTAVGRYTIVRQLGRGGMGVVYLGHDPELDRSVALKVVAKVAQPRRAERLRNRLLREAQAMARLTDPNIVGIYDVVVQGDQVCIAMQYVPGTTLQAWLAEKPRGVPAIVEAFAKAGRGLEAAHRAGIVHRDFKPANVMIDRDGNVRVTDFGLALTESLDDERDERDAGDARDGRDALNAQDEPERRREGDEPEEPSVRARQPDDPDDHDHDHGAAPPEGPSRRPFSSRNTPRLTEAGALVGTPAYMAPEQLARAPCDARADQFAFCAALYEALYGAVPYYDADVRRMAHNKRTGGPVVVPTGSGVPRRVRHTLERGLSRDPGARFPSMRALLVALGYQETRASPWRLVALSLVGTLAVAGVLFFVRPDPRPARAFTLAQRGELIPARDLLRAYLDDHPKDGDAWVLLVMVEGWTNAHSDLTHLAEQAQVALLDDRQRALIDVVVAVDRRRLDEAANIAQAALFRHPEAADLRYAAGEAVWHQGDVERGAGLFLEALERDPRWLMALEHLVPYLLAQRRYDELHAIALRTAPFEPGVAVQLEARRLTSQGKPLEAVALVQQALHQSADEVGLWERLAEANLIAGNLDEARRAAERVAELSPPTTVVAGGGVILSDILLHSGDILRFKQRAPPYWQSVIEVLWAVYGPFYPGAPDLSPVWSAPGPGENADSFRMLLHLSSLYARLERPGDAALHHPDPEVRALAAGLKAEIDDDFAAAQRAYIAGFGPASSGDTAMLLGHHRARAARALGDKPGVLEGCREVLVPRAYLPFRGVLWPDCMLWTAEAESDATRRTALLRQLVSAWTANIPHPAVLEARRLLGGE